MKRLAILLAMLATPATAHDGLEWPAKYRNATGTPCCVVASPEHPRGDCVRVPDSVGSELGISSALVLEFPSGSAVVTINSIYESEEAGYVVCRPGCLFGHTGV